MNDKVIFSAVSLKMTLPGYHIRITTKINLASFKAENSSLFRRMCTWRHQVWVIPRQFEKVKSFMAVSPLPGQFRLIHNGKVVNDKPVG